MAHAICCSSCKIRERGVEGHPNPEDFFRPGTIPFPGHMPSAAGSFRTRRCPFRRRNLSLLQTNPRALCNFHRRRPRASLASRRCMNSLSGAGPVRGRIQRPSVSAGSDLRISKASCPSE